MESIEARLAQLKISQFLVVILFLVGFSSNFVGVTCLETYDFIIVGGGTSGCAVARRLAESRRGFKVLVIETGGLPKEGMDIPANTPYFVGDPEVTYQYKSVAQWGAGLINDGVISIVAGKMLSGTSSLNYMWFNRGNPRDYDNWANKTRDASWSYANMLGHFKRAETYVGEFPSDQHGYKGPITVSQPKYAPGLKHWLEAGRALGYPIADPNGPQRVSFTPVEFSKRFGRRVSSLTGYLNPILKSSNLHILTKTNGTKIVFKGNRAIGVNIRSSLPDLVKLPEDYTVYARKEVIISSGSYGSPLVLQRSGIGPRDVLEMAGIPVVKELPVGLNLQGHLNVPLHFLVNDSSVVFDERRDLGLASFEYFKRFGDGPYSSGRGASGQAFLVSSIAKSEGNWDWPDTHVAMSHSTLPYIGYPERFLRNETVEKGDVPMSASVWLMRPKSRGSIRVNPKDPFGGMPIIDLGYLTDFRDLQAVLDGLNETLKIFETTQVYKRLGTKFRPLNLPECDNDLEFRSTSYWECYIRHASQGACHPAASCTMGRGPGDPSAVVDSKLRVIGIEGLRVVDASIMPFVTNGNTQAAVYGIAEKGSSMILESWV